VDKDEYDKLIDDLNDEAINNLDTWKIGPGWILTGTIKAKLAPGELKPLRITREHRKQFDRWIKTWFSALGASQDIKINSGGRLNQDDENT
jgi:hypothetical protein